MSIFQGDGDVTIINLWSVDENFKYLNMDESRYRGTRGGTPFRDLIAISWASRAGFDTYLDDWGGLLKMEDCRLIGEAIREGAEEASGARRFAVLEEGYPPDLNGV